MRFPLRMKNALLLVTSALVIACTGPEQQSTTPQPTPFTIAVIPDTQNALDYKHQKAEGFAIDSSELFIQQMQFVAERSVSNGGNIVFLASVGDVWQHQTERMDSDHRERGFEFTANPYFAQEIEVTDKAFEVEIPKAIEGYQIISDAGLPFGVAPGNHDYDAMWSDKSFPPNTTLKPQQLTMTPEALGMLHIGGLDNFRSAFGDDKAFFKDKPWYIDSFNGGANSAQKFAAGGYTFLHITLEMQAANDVLDWAQQVVKNNPGLPTIITTHDFLDTHGERRANPIVDLARIDPDHHNSAEQLWKKLIAPNDQIFLVLCGHHHGQAWRVDKNDKGHQVFQILADYQGRGQAGIDQGQALNPYRQIPVGTGDGWFRLMTFTMGNIPNLQVGTYSSHYKAFSSQLETYAQWYKSYEQPKMSDAEFYRADQFMLTLDDFYQRFGKPD